MYKNINESYSSASFFSSLLSTFVAFIKNSNELKLHKCVFAAQAVLRSWDRTERGRRAASRCSTLVIIHANATAAIRLPTFKSLLLLLLHWRVLRWWRRTGMAFIHLSLKFLIQSRRDDQSGFIFFFFSSPLERKVICLLMLLRVVIVVVAVCCVSPSALATGKGQDVHTNAHTCPPLSSF